jgi:hypothetical protein
MEGECKIVYITKRLCKIIEAGVAKISTTTT